MNNESDRRQIIVTGVPTSGKSTFSKLLAKKFGIDRIEIDPMIYAFEKTFPDLGIKHDAPTLESHIQVCKKFELFLFNFIEGILHSDFVIEGFRMSLENVFKKYGKTHQIFYFGFPNITIAKKIENCRKFDIENWTNESSDAELRELFKFLIEESARNKKICEKLNIPFIDTSNNYINQIEKTVDL